MHSTTGRDFPLVACMMCVLNVYVPVTAIVHRLLIGDATAFVHIPPEACRYEVRLLCPGVWCHHFAALSGGRGLAGLCVWSVFPSGPGHTQVQKCVILHLLHSRRTS